MRGIETFGDSLQRRGLWEDAADLYHRVPLQADPTAEILMGRNVLVEGNLIKKIGGRRTG